MKIHRHDNDAIYWRWIGRATAWRAVKKMTAGMTECQWIHRHAAQAMRESARFGVQWRPMKEATK